MKIYTSHSSVYEVGPSGDGKGFVAERAEVLEGQMLQHIGGRFEGAVLSIDMKKGTFSLGGLSVRGITKIES